MNKKVNKALPLRVVASEVIFNVFNKKLSLNELQNEVIKGKKLNLEDIALFKEITFGVMRSLTLLDTILNLLLDRPLGKEFSKLKALFYVGLYQLHFTSVKEYAAINETINACSYLDLNSKKGLINAVLRNYLRKKEEILSSPLLTKSYESKYSFPQWLIGVFKEDYKKELGNILDGSSLRAPMWIRVNNLKISTQDYKKLLLEKGIESSTSELSSSALMLNKPVDALSLPFFDKGYAYIQDISAQYASVLLNPSENDLILDCCSAPGGKSTHLLELNRKVRKIIALDADPLRQKRTIENIKRLHLEFIDKFKVIVQSATNPLPKDYENLKFDKILLDVPCSALGVIRRHPDIKWLRTLEQLNEIVKLQAQILENIWGYLKPNGILLYATCSITKRENSEQISNFLRNHPDAQYLKISDSDSVENPGIQNKPGKNNGDGFYYAKLKKNS